MIRLLINSGEDNFEISVPDSEKQKLESAVKRAFEGEAELLKLDNIKNNGYTIVRSDRIVLYVWVPDKDIEKAKKRQKVRDKLKAPGPQIGGTGKSH